MKSELQAILRKFMQPKFLEVARIMCNCITKQNEAQQSASNNAINLPSVKNSQRKDNSSNGKKQRAASSSTSKVNQFTSNSINPANNSAKHVTGKAIPVNLQPGSSAESKKF